MTRHTDYRAMNGRGLIVRTFADRDLGRAWVRNNAALHTGLHLREVTITTTSRRMYAPPAAVVRRNDFAIPAAA